MTRVIAALLIAWEPLRFASEALAVLPTISFRGSVAVLELLAHGVVAAAAAAAGFALLNRAPDGPRLATFAVIAVAFRTVQSLYFSVLPDNTSPGTEPLYVAVTAVVAIAAVVILRRQR